MIRLGRSKLAHDASHARDIKWIAVVTAAQQIPQSHVGLKPLQFLSLSPARQSGQHYGGAVLWWHHYFDVSYAGFAVPLLTFLRPQVVWYIVFLNVHFLRSLFERAGSSEVLGRLLMCEHHIHRTDACHRSPHYGKFCRITYEKNVSRAPSGY